MKETLKQIAIILVFGSMLGLIVWGIVVGDEQVVKTPAVELNQN